MPAQDRGQQRAVATSDVGHHAEAPEVVRSGQGGRDEAGALAHRGVEPGRQFRRGPQVVEERRPELVLEGGAVGRDGLVQAVPRPHHDRVGEHLGERVQGTPTGGPEHPAHRRQGEPVVIARHR
ncbi:hypothetical protein JOF41_003433 [Saccharothrix coeruleofusca]|nr:hypothetical protein [Saccharothrix coeruleofusca]